MTGPGTDAAGMLGAVAARRSTRGYTDEPVALADLERIIDAARWTGSARNRQPWRSVDVRRVVQALTLAASALGLAGCVATCHPASSVATAAALVHAGPGWLPRHARSLGRAAPVVPRGLLAIPTGRLPVARLLTVPSSADRG